MQVELSAKQLFIIKLALAQLEPVDANVLNETRQLIDSSINLYPGEDRSTFAPYCIYTESEKSNG